MGLLGGILGGVGGAVGGIFGGISKNRQIKEQMKMLNEQKKLVGEQQKENQDWFDRRYNEDATQRTDAQALLNKTEESIRNRNQQTAATAVVTGGTEESVAAARAANNQALTDVTSNIAATADARKDAIEAQYMQRKDSLNDKLSNLYGKEGELRAQKKSIFDIASGAIGGAAGGIAMGID